MKKIIALLLCLMVLLLPAACAKTPKDTTSKATAGETTPPATETTAVTQAATTSTLETTGTTAEPTTTAMPTTTAATSAATSAATTGPSNSARMYSSYAHMVSYDPARGWADFDYFNMLVGDDAVAWLVEHEGYSLADAQALVADFADSEFIEQNENPQLRTIDLRDIDLKLMYYPDGTMVTDATPIDSELIDLYNLYHVNPDLVLDSFFYYVKVVGGEVVSVKQVYWP
jgi:hypothetical protein